VVVGLAERRWALDRHACETPRVMPVVPAVVSGYEIAVVALAVVALAVIVGSSLLGIAARFLRRVPAAQQPGRRRRRRSSAGGGAGQDGSS
jgi:hypothetical protein